MRWAVVLILAGGLGVAGVRAGWGKLSPAGASEPTIVPATGSTYDVSQNRTIFATGPLPLAGGFTVSASFAVNGRVSRGTPLVPGVVLTVTGPLDVARTGTGEIVDLGVYYGGTLKHRLGRVTRDGRVATFAVEPAAFASLAVADDAGVRVGSSTINLTPEVRAAFKSLAARWGGGR